MRPPRHLLLLSLVVLAACGVPAAAASESPPPAGQDYSSPTTVAPTSVVPNTHGATTVKKHDDDEDDESTTTQKPETTVKKHDDEEDDDEKSTTTVKKHDDEEQTTTTHKPKPDDDEEQTTTTHKPKPDDDEEQTTTTHKPKPDDDDDTPTTTVKAPKKVFVCKYVGKPGVDERLQTGNNPISVSVNSIRGPIVIGAFFADAQGRSVVIAFDVGQPEPSLDKCPPPDGGTTTTTSTTVKPNDTTTTTSTTAEAERHDHDNVDHAAERHNDHVVVVHDVVHYLYDDVAAWSADAVRGRPGCWSMRSRQHPPPEHHLRHWSTQRLGRHALVRHCGNWCLGRYADPTPLPGRCHSPGRLPADDAERDAHLCDPRSAPGHCQRRVSGQLHADRHDNDTATSAEHERCHDDDGRRCYDDHGRRCHHDDRPRSHDDNHAPACLRRYSSARHTWGHIRRDAWGQSRRQRGNTNRWESAVYRLQGR